LHIARGSLYELETLLKIAEMLQITKEEKFQKIQEQIQECLRLLMDLLPIMKSRP
jgi:S23 ribosomal protein.